MNNSKIPLMLKVLGGLSVVLLIAALFVVFLYAPFETVMGAVQKVFYFHVASLWVGMLGFLVAAITAGIYLRTAAIKWDLATTAGIEIGLVFTVIGVISGSIWAKPIWNTWWTWDPRLTTTTIMGLIYMAYFILRQAVDDPHKSARFGSVYAIIGFLSVPLTFFSIRLFRTIHPVVIASSDSSAFDMSPAMLQTFLFSLLTYSVLFAAIFWFRLRLGKQQYQLDQRRIQLMEEQQS